MRIVFVAMLSSLTIMQHGYCQGAFTLFNETAPTRLGSIDGPLAGPGIWAHALGGFSTNSLEPVGLPVQHIGGGFISGLQIIVPWADVAQTIFVQMVAWDGRRAPKVPVTRSDEKEWVVVPKHLLPVP